MSFHIGEVYGKSGRIGMAEVRALPHESQLFEDVTSWKGIARVNGEYLDVIGFATPEQVPTVWQLK